MQDLLTRGIDEHGNIRSEETHMFVVKRGIKVPEEWDVESIGDVCDVTKLAGFEFTKYFDYNVKGEIIALRALNIKNEELNLVDIQTIPKKVSEQLVRSKINKGDVLITYIGAYIGDVLMIHESNKYHLAPNIAKITPSKKIASEYLEILLRSHLVQSQIKNLVATTATPSLTMTQIRNTKVAYPREVEEQVRVVNYLNSIKTLIKSEVNTLNKLHSLKTALMQDLLSGRVRIQGAVKEETV
jgi:type I restriction enzyme S subunit